jgi:hypothetical protein
MAEVTKPRYTVSVAGQKLGLQYDLNKNPTKRGIKLQFVLESSEMEPKEKQELTQKISTALQKRFGDVGLIITLDDRVPYENVIGFTIPLESIATHLTKIIKGEHK